MFPSMLCDAIQVAHSIASEARPGVHRARTAPEVCLPVKMRTSAGLDANGAARLITRSITPLAAERCESSTG